LVEFSTQGLADKKEIYELILSQAEHLFDESDNQLSGLSNFTALIRQALGYVSWVGFYIYDGSRLYLGPFQGKVACTSIAIGKGVCGTSAEKRETVIVPDVDKFPGHIACDSASRSEIVLPVVLQDGSLYGVLDLDSTEYNSFDDTDAEYLSKLVEILTKKVIKL